MGKLENTLLGISLIGLLSLGWCNYKQNNTLDKQKTEINSLRDDSLNLAFHNNNLKNSYADSRNKTNFYSDSLGKVLNLYSKTNSEIKKLNQELGGIKGAKKKILGELEKYKIADNTDKVWLLEKYDSLFKVYAFVEKEIAKKILETNNLEKKYSELEKDYALSLKSGDSEWKVKYAKLKESYDKLSDERNLEEAVRENMNSYNVKSNTEEEFSLKVKNNKSFLETLFESKRPRLKKMGEKYVVFKDDFPEGMQAFVADEEGRQTPLKKVDNQGIFSYSHIKFRDGKYSFYAWDKDDNESQKYFFNISGGIISKNKLD